MADAQNMDGERALAQGIKVSVGKQLAPLKDQVNAVGQNVERVAGEVHNLSQGMDAKLGEIRDGVRAQIADLGTAMAAEVRASAQAPLLGTPEKIQAFLEEMSKD